MQDIVVTAADNQEILQTIVLSTSVYLGTRDLHKYGNDGDPTGMETMFWDHCRDVREMHK